MEIIKLKLKKHPYNIIVGSNIFNRLPGLISKLKIGRDAYIITNHPVKNQYGQKLIRALKPRGFSLRFKTVADTEKSKSIATLTSVIKDIAAFDRKKQIFIIALGGGVIGDLAGFVASVYRRGIPYIQIPTTLLAQVDSSIGGKTAVDLSTAKNLVGTFYQPSLVFADVSLLKSLNLRQVQSGLAEVIKYGVIQDRFLFNYLENNYQKILRLQLINLELVVRRCVKIKAGIVGEDEKEEKGIRTILNFGHTVGHAIEAAGGYRGFSHGEAISLGMLAASSLSCKLGLLGNKDFLRLKSLIVKIGLPTALKGVVIGDIIRAYYHDKKFKGAENKFVLLEGIGKPKIVKNIPLGVIKEALQEIV